VSVPNAPEPDPALGEAAAEEAAAARRDIESQLADGSLTITDVFEMSDQEAGQSSHRIVGHMHLRAALLALPHIGEVKADEILEEVGLEGDRHIDTIGDNEQQTIAEAVEARQPQE
jgi:hypothetical protein